MKLTEDLYALINRMSPNEKRFFKLFANKHQGQRTTNYLKLFNALNALAEPNEIALRKKLMGTSILNFFPTEKRKLYDLLLDALVAYQKNENRFEEVISLIVRVDLLQSKGLYSQALHILQKGKKKAKEHEEFAALNEALLRERRLIKHMQLPGWEEKLQDLWEESHQARQNLNAWLEVRELHDRMLLFVRRNFFLDKEIQLSNIKALLDNSILDIREKDLPAVILQYIHQIKAMGAHALGEPQQAKIHFEQSLKIWQENPGLSIRDPRGYKIILSNFLNSCFQTDSYKEFAAGLKEFKSLSVSTWDEEGESFQNLAFYELLYLINQSQFEAAVELIADITPKLELYEEKINPARLLTFYYNFAVLYFVLEDFSNCEKWISLIRDHPKTASRDDLKRIASILGVLIQMELGNYQLAESRIRALRRRLQKQDRFSEFYQISIACFDKLNKAPLPADRLTAISNYRQQLAEIKLASNKRTTGLEELTIWTASRITNRPMKEIARHYLQQETR